MAPLALFLKCDSVIKSLHETTGKYNRAGSTITSLASEVDTIEFAWIWIKEWAY